jgi:hypothetical protein
MSTPLDEMLYQQAKGHLDLRRNVGREAGYRAGGAFSDVQRGMTAKQAADAWRFEQPGMDPAAKAAAMKDINDQLMKLAELDAKMKADADKMSSDERIKIASMQSDIRGKLIDAEIANAELQGSLADKRAALEYKAIEDEKQALLENMPGRITDKIREKAGKWAQSSLATGGIDPTTGLPSRTAAIDPLRAAELAQEVAGMGPGEKSAYLDAIAEASGVDSGSLMASLNGLARTGDPAAIDLLREYQADRSHVQTKMGEWEREAAKRDERAKEITKGLRAGVSKDRLQAIVDMGGGKEGFDVAQGKGGSGQEPGTGDGEPKASPFGADRDRLLGQLDALEKDSNEPQIVQSKRAIMESPKFQEWMKASGISDPNVAFKTFTRIAGKVVRQERQAGRAQGHALKKEAGLTVAPDFLAPQAPRQLSSAMPTAVRENITGEGAKAAEDKRKKAEEDAFWASLGERGT